MFPPYQDTSRQAQPTPPDLCPADHSHPQRRELPALPFPSDSPPEVLPDNLRLSNSLILRHPAYAHYSMPLLRQYFQDEATGLLSYHALVFV